jgi:hypothetical protein
MQSALKTALMATTLYALAGLANSVSAATCTDTSETCTTGPVNAGADRQLTLRCTANVLGGPDAGRYTVVDVATGWGIGSGSCIGSGSRPISVPTEGAYRCTVRAGGRPDARVFCSLK